MPADASGRASARMRKVLAIKYMPIPVTIHAMTTSMTAASCAMFCGRLKMPPPIMALTTSAARGITPSFFSFPAIMIPLPFGSVFRGDLLQKLFNLLRAGIVMHELIRLELFQQTEKLPGMNALFIRNVQKDGFGAQAVDGIRKLRVESDGFVFGGDHVADRADEFVVVEFVSGFDGRRQ